ncbi:MAG: hypothetical protein K5745_08115 [Saccharofermentans sp.]|nr:hypothetical protein [Saccharofermentans sp.]
MRLTKDKEFITRLILTLIGVPMTGVAVAFFNVSGFGVDPFTLMVQGIDNLLPVDYGLTYIIISVLEIVAVFLLDRTLIGIGTVINMFFLGYINQYTSMLLRTLFNEELLYVRIIFLIIGILLQGICLAMYITGDLGVSTHDAVSLIASKKLPKVKFAYLRIISDTLCAVIGIICGGVFGIGTIISAFAIGPLAAFVRKHFTDKLRPSLQTNK